jgi:four helix bundle protein
MHPYTFAFEKLDVWKLAKEFSIEMYKITKKFPQEERFGLVSQLNRATISVASNIAEGSARKSRKDKAHFYQIAYASLMEVASQLIIVWELGLIAVQDYTSLRTKLHKISNKLNALYNSQLNNSTV